MVLKKKIQNSLIDSEDFSNSHLSMLISLDEISYSVFDKDLIDVVILVSYEFDTRVKNPEELLKNLKEVFDKEPILSAKFDSINVAHKNNLSAMVPDALYDSNSQEDYLKYTVKLLQNDTITVDSISVMNSKNIFIPFKNVNNFLVNRLGEFDYLHASSVLVSTLLQNYKNNLEKQLFINVSNSSIDVVYINEGDLQMFNTFLYYTKEDFLYYILFAMERLQLNPNEQKVTFIGNIDKGSELYELAYTYIRYIDFSTPNNYTLSDEFFIENPDVKKHHYFELLNQF